MRFNKPRRGSLDEVRITREGETATIESADPEVSVVHLTVGPQIKDMSDVAILKLFNLTVDARDELAAGYDNIVVEVPPGRPQIKYSEDCDQWVPRGQVLRCLIEDDENGELIVYIDDQRLSLGDFSRLLKTYAGWGMRIAFVPDDLVADEPEVQVREPSEDDA